MLAKDAYFENLLSEMNRWMTPLAKPFTPPREVPVGEDGMLLEFCDKRPETVMVGKLVRAVSGINAAMHLAEIGYVTECGALLRVVSDLSEEIFTIGMALQARYDGKPMNKDVQTFVEQYFFPLASTPDDFAKQSKVRYVSREKLLLAKVALSPAIPGMGSDMILKLARYLNKVYDGFVHGCYESTMQLWSTEEKAFELLGRSDADVKAEFVDATIHKLHEVVAAIEITANMTGCDEVNQAAREARRKMDSMGISLDPRLK